jgi:hypothetical protein
MMKKIMSMGDQYRLAAEEADKKAKKTTGLTKRGAGPEERVIPD